MVCCSRSFFEVASGAAAGPGVAAAALTDEPLEAAGAWGDDDDVLEENKVPIYFYHSLLA